MGRELLSLAKGIGAGMLVMGCYGHSRARELLLGGSHGTHYEERKSSSSRS